MSTYSLVQLIIICNIESYSKNEGCFSFNEYTPTNYMFSVPTADVCFLKKENNII